MRYIFGYLSPPRVYASVLNEIFKKRVGFFFTIKVHCIGMQ